MPGKEIKGRSKRANYRHGGRIKAADKKKYSKHFYAPKDF